MNKNISFILGFAIFGFMIGNIAGLSTAELTITLLGLLFSIIGGSIIAFIKNIDHSMQKLAGKALFFFSLMVIIGLYIGLFVRINDLLSTPSDDITKKEQKAEYLKALEGDEIEMLKKELMQGSMTLEEVCEFLKKKSADE